MGTELRYKRIGPSFLLLICLLLSASCAPLYFRHLPSPTEPFQFRSLKDLPYRELWSGFVFSGEKVGFTHLRITPSEGEETYLLESEAHLRIRFLGMDKRVSLKSRDRVWPDLTLVSFDYEIKMDEKTWTLWGDIREGNFQARVRAGEMTKSLDKKLETPLYPASAVNLYPVLKGLAVGSRYRFLVFDPQTQSFVEVSQQVTSFEKSNSLGIEPSYKLDTEMLGHSVSTWINQRGEAVFEMGMGGVLITHKEDEEQAKRFLSEATLNKKDFILDFSLVKTPKPIPCPRETIFLEIALEGFWGKMPLLQGPGQEALEQKREGKSIAVYRLRSEGKIPPQSGGETLTQLDLAPYLTATVHMESDHPEIRSKAREVVAGAASPEDAVQRLTQWVAKEVMDETVDSLSALEVLHTRKGECQAHTMLYAAMARAVGIPTKLVGGLVYAEGMGFLYHAWAESYLGGWIAIDPTFNQVGVDATHIKLVEGPSWTSLLPLGKVVGKIKAVVLDHKEACTARP